MTGPETLDSLTAIVGVSGGLGASTLTLACALHQAHETGGAAAIDLDLGAGGLDVTGALEDRPGLRWSDLALADGELSGEGLRSRLPALGRTHVLSSGREPGQVPEPVIAEVLRALCGGRVPAVADLPGRPGSSFGPLARAGRVLLLAAATTRSLADLDALRTRLPPDLNEVGLVLRVAGRGEVDVTAIEEHFDLPVAATLNQDARVSGQAERGRWPLPSRRAPARTAATLWRRGWLA